MIYRPLKTTTLTPHYAVKATRGMVDMWFFGSQFGMGKEPMQRVLGQGERELKAAAEAILVESIGIRLTQYEGQD